MKNSPIFLCRKCSRAVYSVIIFTSLFNFNWSYRGAKQFQDYSAYYGEPNYYAWVDTSFQLSNEEYNSNVNPYLTNQNVPVGTPLNFNSYSKQPPHVQNKPNVHQNFNDNAQKVMPQNVHQSFDSNVQKQTLPNVHQNSKNPSEQRQTFTTVNPYLKNPNSQKEASQCVCPVNTCNGNGENYNNYGANAAGHNNGVGNKPNTAQNNGQHAIQNIGALNSCEIPEHGPETLYTVYDPMDNEIRSQPGIKVPKGSTIQLTCQNGYLHEDGESSYLSTCAGINKVFWNPPLINCLKTCKLLTPRNVELICTFKGVPVNCSNTLLAGTEVQPQECEPPFHQSFRPDYRILTCKENGEWDNILFKCNPDCGKPQDSETLIYDGLPSTNGVSSPWNIAIYDIRSSPPILICGGTIVSPLMIISAAHCFYAESEHSKQSNHNYRLVTGKIKRSYSSQDTDAQNEYEVKEILFSSDNTYRPEIKSYAADIAILIVRELISFNFRVLPACIDWIAVHRFKPRKIKYGKLYGWGVDSSGMPSEVLRTADLPYISYNDCLKKVATLEFDKFCAGYDFGAGARKGDSGAGLVFENEADRLYYLRGIVSSRDKNTNSSIAKFTDLTFHIKWIGNVYNNIENEVASRPIPTTVIKQTPVPQPVDKNPCNSRPVWKDGLCEAPEQSTDKTYVIRDTNYNEVLVEPSTKVPESYTLSFQCKEDYLLPEPNTVSRNFFARCQQAGLWDPPVQNCSRICEMILPAIHATISCVFENKPINCTNNMVTGTLVYSRCDPQFHYDRLLNYSQMTCQKNGKYDVILGDCVPDCGKTNPMKLVFDGKQAELGEDPWNVAIYDVHQKPPLLVCSGTIVSPNMIVSAANCFVDEKMTMKNKPSDYQIVVGKFTKNYNSTDSSWQKIYKVKEIRFTDRGTYSLGYFAADIAVLVSQDNIVFHRQVMPACLDWRSTRNLYFGENSQGRYVAWNPAGLGQANDTLKAATMKFININDCSKRISNKNLESDIFCAKSTDGSEIRRIESGGSLVFINPSDRAYYLRGIGHSYDVSSGLSEFTDTSKYIDWLYDIYSQTWRM